MAQEGPLHPPASHVLAHSFQCASNSHVGSRGRDLASLLSGLVCVPGIIITEMRPQTKSDTLLVWKVWTHTNISERLGKSPNRRRFTCEGRRALQAPLAAGWTCCKATRMTVMARVAGRHRAQEREARQRPTAAGLSPQHILLAFLPLKRKPLWPHKKNHV